MDWQYTILIVFLIFVFFSSVIIAYFIWGKKRRSVGTMKSSNYRPDAMGLIKDIGIVIFEKSQRLPDGRIQFTEARRRDDNRPVNLSEPMDERMFEVYGKLGAEFWLDRRCFTGEEARLAEHIHKMAKERSELRQELTNFRERFDEELSKAVENLTKVAMAGKRDKDRKGDWANKGGE